MSSKRLQFIFDYPVYTIVGCLLPQLKRPHHFLELFCSQSLYMGGAGSNSQSCLLTQSFGIFRVFLRNQRKYGQDPLERPPWRSLSPIILGPQSSQSDLYLQPNGTQFKTKAVNNNFKATENHQTPMFKLLLILITVSIFISSETYLFFTYDF